MAQNCGNTTVRDAALELRQGHKEIASEVALTSALQEMLDKARKTYKQEDSSFMESTKKLQVRSR